MDENPDKAVLIGPRLIASGDFDKLYREGMGLIEEVAAYLDGDGREDSRTLGREASFVYATESMRLTTKLMQMASWLLLQKAVSEGEISSQGARREKEKLKFSPTPKDRGGPGWDELPQILVDYIKKGDRLYERVIQFDRLDSGNIADASAKAESASAASGGIADQLSRIQNAFGAGKKSE